MYIPPKIDDLKTVLFICFDPLPRKSKNRNLPSFPVYKRAFSACVTVNAPVSYEKGIREKVIRTLLKNYWNAIIQRSAFVRNPLRPPNP